MKNEIAYSEESIGEIVVADFRAAEIFKKAGIDFCCGGKKKLVTACQEKNIDPLSLEKQLQELANISTGQTHNFNNWELDFLADYIINTHHKYVLKTLPELTFYTQKIATVHGSYHPELIEVQELFGKINTDLLEHLKKEEEILFPAIKDQLKSNSKKTKELIKSEIEIMTAEHEFAGDAMDRINQVTLNYTLPEGACNSYHVTFKLLQQFEEDLHVHVHLENNILYPKALKLAN